MQIKLYGNGHFCNIPVQEIIDKYWKDETAPFSFEMSTAIGDETIAATAMLGEESPDTYPSIRLDSRNARKNSSATWFILETPNETNPYVTGYAYAGNDETESDSWITKIVDAPRGADDDSKRLVYIDDDIAETVDTKTASKLNTKYGNHCADYCATSDQLFEGKFNYEKFGKRLAANDKDIEFVEGMIVSKNENVINHVADILDALGFTATTGYYDPAGLGSMSDRFRLLWKQSMRRKIRLFSVCRSATVPSNRCSICTTTLVWIWNPIISAVPSGTTRIE